MKRITLLSLLLLLTSEFASAIDMTETRKLAEQGDAWYQTEMGLMYHNGKGVKKDYTEAVKWYRMAADQGLVKAQTNLGVMYAEGLGVEQDFGQAASWFREAANQGNALAQHNLGLLYGRGQGVTQDYAEAFVWESLAAAAGHENAITNRDICASKLSPEALNAAQRRAERLFQRFAIRKPTN